MSTEPFVTAINSAFFELFCPEFGNCHKPSRSVPSGQSSITFGLTLPSDQRSLMATSLVNQANKYNPHRIIEIHVQGERCTNDCAKWRIYENSFHAFDLSKAVLAADFVKVADLRAKRELGHIMDVLRSMVRSSSTWGISNIMKELRQPVDASRDEREQLVREMLGSQHHFGSPALREHIELLRTELAEI